MRKGHPRGSETWDDVPNAPIGFNIENENAQLGENDHKLVQNNKPLDEEMLVRNTYVNAQLVSLEDNANSTI
jgi:hypothetical protein